MPTAAMVMMKRWLWSAPLTEYTTLTKPAVANPAHQSGFRERGNLRSRGERYDPLISPDTKSYPQSHLCAVAGLIRPHFGHVIVASP
jgi:hypothetical protein